MAAQTNKRIYLSPPHMSGEELKYIRDAFETNWVAPAGPHIEAFEKELARYSGAEHCAALSSGTAAIHLALVVLGVQRGDEVVCSSFTFAGSCFPVSYVSGIPVFVDSEQDTWNMDPSLLEEAIRERIKKGRKPKAIVAVHLYGMPAKMDDIMAVSKRYEVPVIEDAAEALGSTYLEQKAGSFGDIGIFSFNGNKIITSSGGGALVSKNKEWVQKAKFLATQARDPAPHYEHSETGYNYRLSNICAGIGLGQLSVLEERVQQRRSVFEFYKARLGRLPGVSFQPEQSGSVSNRWLTTMLIDPTRNKNGIGREDVRLALEKQNIESRPLWKPMHEQPVFSSAPAYTHGVSSALFEAGICLPSGSSLTPKQLSMICEIISDLIIP